MRLADGFRGLFEELRYEGDKVLQATSSGSVSFVLWENWFVGRVQKSMADFRVLDVGTSLGLKIEVMQSLEGETIEAADSSSPVTGVFCPIPRQADTDKEDDVGQAYEFFRCAGVCGTD